MPQIKGRRKIVEFLTRLDHLSPPISVSIVMKDNEKAVSAN